jgi:hypothetical protein
MLSHLAQIISVLLCLHVIGGRLEVSNFRKERLVTRKSGQMALWAAAVELFF